MIGQSYTALRQWSTLGATFALLWLTPAEAQLGRDMSAEEIAYEFCLNQVATDPEAAFDRAIAWEDQGGGPAAVHCSAVALIALEQFGDAATRLDEVAQNTNNGLTANVRAELLQQSANAWMMEGFPLQAVQSLDAALALEPTITGLSTSLWFDRARAHVMDGNWPDAIDNLMIVISDQPGAKDALTLRATGYRSLGEVGLAQEDLARVLDDDPDYAPALIERGVVHRFLGNDDAARADWIRVLLLEETGELADAARRHLHELDFPEGMPEGREG